MPHEAYNLQRRTCMVEVGRIGAQRRRMYIWNSQTEVFYFKNSNPVPQHRAYGQHMDNMLFSAQHAP